jgi:hypothetical protein
MPRTSGFGRRVSNTEPPSRPVVVITIRYPISSWTEDEALARARDFVADLQAHGVDASVRVERWVAEEVAGS